MVLHEHCLGSCIDFDLILIKYIQNKNPAARLALHANYVLRFFRSVKIEINMLLKEELWSLLISFKWLLTTKTKLAPFLFLIWRFSHYMGITKRYPESDNS